MVGVIFFAAAAWFVFGSHDSVPPRTEPAVVGAAAIDPAPLRTVLGDPPRIDIGGYMQTCSECHDIFESRPDAEVNLLQHQHIVLDHGLNDRCYNCHSEEDRDKLVLHGEREIGYDEVETLCAKCHGPTFRDWERGMHGRTKARWDAAPGATERLLCTECHDPPRPGLRPGGAPARPEHAADGGRPRRSRRGRRQPPPEASPMNASTVDPSPHADPTLSRRSFLRTGFSAAGAMTAFVAALSPLRDVDPDDLPSIEKLVRKHYKEMTPEDMRAALAKIAAEVKKRHGLDAVVRDVKPKDGVEFVYALNLTRCIGCRKCVHACAAENNTSRSPEIQYIRVVEMPKGTIDLEKGDHHYDRPVVPSDDHYYMPVQCHQCANPPCVKVCPIEATWQEPDGITVIDYDWCIGCRYCEAACPYWARRFNYAEPEIAPEEINTDMSYLSNRPRPKGVMEKCTFCLHRTREGKLPACLEVCPVGARKFGNVLDPESEVSQILREKRVFVLKEEVGTLPRFFYYFDERYPRTDAVPSGQPAGAEEDGR